MTANNKYTGFEQRMLQQNGQLFTVIDPVTLDLASGGNRDGEIFSNEGAKGMILIVKLSAEAGTAGVTPHLYVRDEDGNVIVVRSEAALTANGTYTYVYEHGATTGAGGWNGAGVTACADIAIPREWGLRINKSTGDTDQTFTIEAHAMYLID